MNVIVLAVDCITFCGIISYLGTKNIICGKFHCLINEQFKKITFPSRSYSEAISHVKKRLSRKNSKAVHAWLLICRCKEINRRVITVFIFFLVWLLFSINASPNLMTHQMKHLKDSWTKMKTQMRRIRGVWPMNALCVNETWNQIATLTLIR